MSFNADSLGLSRSAVPLLRDLVHERTGLFYENSRCDLMADRLSGLVTDSGLQSFLDYYYFLKYDTPATGTEWARVMDALSVPESYFWREIDQLQAVVSTVLPVLAQRTPSRTITIWCVPCAGGEEPLTLAMLLENAGWFQRTDIALHASDASPLVLERAQQGRFRDRAFRVMPPHQRDRYFTRCGDAWKVDPALHARVRSWSVVNLRNLADVGPRAQADIILCRNVFIYFSPSAIAQVVDVFADRMPVPGYLCIGATESLLRVTDRFDMEEIGGAFMYVKRRDTPGGDRP
jgi:chemotaxis protein methyltransferase CheR